jgi:hypothetical protein
MALNGISNRLEAEIRKRLAELAMSYRTMVGGTDE